MFLKRATKWTTGLVTAATLLIGQEPQWKDRAEYELVVEQLGKATDPNKKLELLNQWKQKYPQTAFESARRIQFLFTYQALNKAPEMLGAAKEIASAEPKNWLGHYWIMLLGQSMATTNAAAAEDGEKAANSILTNLNDFFSAANKPAGAADAAWNTQKEDAQDKAYQALIAFAQVKKDQPLIEKRLGEYLKAKPKNGMVTYQLGASILAQRKPERQAEAIWHFARACGLTGAGEVPAANKAQICGYFQKVYPQFRGDTKGMDDLKNSAGAAAEPFPPQAFAIKTKQQEDIEQINKIKAENPQLAIWIELKQALSAADGENYFAMLKDAKLPKLKGKLISHEPATNPKKLVIGISDASVAEVTLVMEDKTFLPGKMDPGGEIEFEGVGKEFTKEPFMVTLEIDKEAITGWTGTAAAKTVTKKAAPKGGVKKKK